MSLEDPRIQEKSSKPLETSPELPDMITPGRKGAPFPGQDIRSSSTGIPGGDLRAARWKNHVPRPPEDHLQVHRLPDLHLADYASKSGPRHRWSPTQYLVVPRERSGSRDHKILASRQVRENPPAGRAHSRPDIRSRPHLSRAVPGILSASWPPRARKRKKNTKGK